MKIEFQKKASRKDAKEKHAKDAKKNITGPGFNPFILPLNELFVLNFVGGVILVLVFWFALRRFNSKVWLVDAVMIVYAAAAFGAWLMLGRPNPMGLGYLSKGIEIVLIAALLTHIWTKLRPVSPPAPSSERNLGSAPGRG